MSTQGQLPDIDSLRCFLAAFDRRNFRQAARDVGLSPGAFSARIRQFEELVGASLFERTTRSVLPTDHARQMEAQVRSALALLTHTLFGNQKQSSFQGQELFVGTRHELGMSWLLPAFPSFEKLSGAHLHLYVGSGPDLAYRVRSRHLDCAVSSSPIRDPELDGIELHEEQYVFVAPKGAAQKLKDTGWLERQTLLDTTFELPLFKYLRDAPGFPSGLRFERTRCLGAIAAIRHMVLLGHGVAVLPEYFVRQDLKRGSLVALVKKEALLSDSFRLIVRKKDQRAPLLSMFAEHLRAHPLR